MTDKYDSYYKQSVWLQVRGILDFLSLMHFGEKILYLPVKLSGVVAKNVHIVSFAFNPAWLHKVIIGLHAIFHVGNF